MVKTTAQMDGWDDENDPERYSVYAQCMECGGWTFIKSDKEHYGNSTHGAHCEHCGSSRFNPQSVTSKRTFDLVRAKKKETEVKKLIAKRRMV